MTQPNILFILLDDLGWADLGVYGSTFYETPNLDKLAQEGLTFSDAYAAAPVCSPTRASLLTGKYPATVGVTQYIGGHGVGKLCDVPYFHHLPLSEVSLASALSEGGYVTWHVGKWHLGNSLTWPEKHGFEVNIGGCDAGHPPQGYFSPYGIPTLSDGPAGEYLTDRLTDEAIGLIENSNGQPFFLNLWHYAVHTPIQAPAALIEKYQEKARRLGLEDTLLELGERFPVGHKSHLRVTRRRVQSDPTYAAMIENLDWNIGRLLASLDRAGKRDDTLVIFTSDNGGLSTAEGAPTCNTPLAEGKGWLCDGGVREPLVVSWPGVVQRGRTATPVTSPDFYPTLLGAAGLPPRPGQHSDGVSFMPLLRGEAFERGPIFWHYPHYSNQGGTPGAAVREGDYKLLYSFEDERVELYNLREDSGESRNLANMHESVAANLMERLQNWQSSLGLGRPRPNPNWQ